MTSTDFRRRVIKGQTAIPDFRKGDEFRRAGDDFEVYRDGKLVWSSSQLPPAYSRTDRLVRWIDRAVAISLGLGAGVYLADTALTLLTGGELRPITPIEMLLLAFFFANQAFDIWRKA